MKTTKSIKLIATVIAICLSFTAPSVFAASSICGNDSVPESVQAASGCSNSAPNITTVIQNILNGIILILGVIAVIYIVIGGVTYMTSTGDPGKTKKAKDTILYATIGLVICALSAAIVNFTIGLINNSGNTNLPSTSDEETQDNPTDNPTDAPANTSLFLDLPSEEIAHLPTK